MSYYIHHVPGRLRIQTARLRRAECQGKLGTMLDALPGIDSHSHNGKIGSVLIHYDTARLSADDILYHLHKAGCLDSPISATPTTSASGDLVKQAGALFGNALFGTLLRKSVETSVLSLARGFR
ncbi:MAG: heavy-metal-associated domain-containing protein [Gammaproteobacteria bacterium]|nr:heavy-metal-associated domain-containing protein [Gammaproteobacteria bacterium]